jgi:hypothetical protein
VADPSLRKNLGFRQRAEATMIRFRFIASVFALRQSAASPRGRSIVRRAPRYFSGYDAYAGSGTARSVRSEDDATARTGRLGQYLVRAATGGRCHAAARRFRRSVGGHGVLYTADSSWRVRDGKLVSATADGNDSCRSSGRHQPRRADDSRALVDEDRHVARDRGLPVGRVDHRRGVDDRHDVTADLDRRGA